MNVALELLRPKPRRGSTRWTHLFDTLFHKMGIDGVYARTALYEDMIERLAALITAHREPGTEVMRFPPVMNREHAGEVRIPEELSEPAGLRLRPARHRARDPFRRRAASMPAATGPRRCRRPISCCRRRPAIRSIRSRRAAARCRQAACASTSLRDCFRAEPSQPSRPAAILPDARISSASALPRMSRFPRALDGARARHRARPRPRLHRSTMPATRSSAGSGQMKAVSQMQQSLKFELLVPLRSEDAADGLHELQLPPRPFRHHLGYQGRAMASRRIPDASRSAWTGSRSAMFHTHGTDLAKWPAAVRETLALR